MNLYPQKLSLDQPAAYQIRVQGCLDGRVAEWFPEMAIYVDRPDGSPPITTLSGTISDQAALHGLLSQLYDLGLAIVEVVRI